MKANNNSPSFHGIGFKLKKLTSIHSSNTSSHHPELLTLSNSPKHLKNPPSQSVLPSLSPNFSSSSSINPLNSRQRFGSLPQIFPSSPKKSLQSLFALKESSYPLKAKQLKSDVSINSSYRLFQDIKLPSEDTSQKITRASKSPNISIAEISERASKKTLGSLSQYKHLINLENLVKEASEETEVSNEAQDADVKSPVFGLKNLKDLGLVDTKYIMNKQAMISESANNSTRNHYTKKLKLSKKTQAGKQLASLINAKISELPLEVRKIEEDEQANLKSIQLSDYKKITIKDTSSPNTERSFGEEQQSLFQRKVPKLEKAGFKSFLAANGMKTIELNSQILNKDSARSPRDGGLSKDTIYSLNDKREALQLGSPRRKNLIKFNAASEEMKCFNNLALGVKNMKINDVSSLCQIIRKKKDQTKRQGHQIKAFKEICKGVVKPEEYFGAQDRSMDREMFFLTDRDDL